MRKHYVHHGDTWHQVHPLIVTRVDGDNTPQKSGLIKFYQHDLNIPMPAPMPVDTDFSGFNYVSNICMIDEHDQNYKVEEIEYGVFDEKGKFLYRVEHPTEARHVDTYIMEMKRL